MTPAVELRNVCCGGKGVPGSLEGVSLSVAAGECLAPPVRDGSTRRRWQP